MRDCCVARGLGDVYKREDVGIRVAEESRGSEICVGASSWQVGDGGWVVYFMRDK